MHPRSGTHNIRLHIAAVSTCINAVPANVQEYQSKDLPNSRIQPDRRWFGNTRVIGQKQLEQFREEMTAKVRCSEPTGLHRLQSPARAVA